MSGAGHNGIKSVVESLRGVGGDLRDKGVGIVRVAVGIGRPQSRSPDAVVPYVMANMTQDERQAIEGCSESVRKIIEKEVRKIEERAQNWG